MRTARITGEEWHHSTSNKLHGKRLTLKIAQYNNYLTLRIYTHHFYCGTLMLLPTLNLYFIICLL